MKATTCCFTGHRDIPEEIEEGVRAAIRKQVLVRLKKGYTDFLVGGARGFDMLAAEVLLDLREKDGAELRLISVLPFPDWRAGWPAKDFRREDRIMKHSDEILFSAAEHSRQSYLVRDRKMVDESSVCIAWCTRESGGTAYTIRYAMKKGVMVINLAGQDTAG